MLMCQSWVFFLYRQIWHIRLSKLRWYLARCHKNPEELLRRISGSHCDHTSLGQLEISWLSQQPSTRDRISTWPDVASECDVGNLKLGRSTLEMGTDQFVPVCQGSSTGTATPLPHLLWLKQPFIRPSLLASDTSSTDLPVPANSSGFSALPSWLISHSDKKGGQRSWCPCPWLGD